MMEDTWDDEVTAEVIGQEYVDDIESTLPQRKLFKKWSLNVQVTDISLRVIGFINYIKI